MQGTTPYSFLIETALKSTALLSGACLAVLLLRQKSAALRHLVWNAAFASVLALPILSILLPVLRISVASSVLTSSFILQSDVQASGHETSAKARPDSLAGPELRPRTQVHWGMLLTLLWAAGATVSLGQMLIGLAVMERVQRRSKLFETPGFASLTKLLGIEGEVTLLETSAGSMPVTYGPFRPAIFMPADAIEWDAERRRMVLLHELAHVRRGDPATHLLARTALGLYWWNPMIWAAWHAFLKERERAADDLVLMVGACASDYASHLLEVASSMRSPARYGWAAVPMARRSQLESRLSAILDDHRDRRTPQWKAVLIASLLALLVVAPVAAMQAKSDADQAAVVSQAGVPSAVAFLIKQGDEASELGKWDQAQLIYRKALSPLNKGPEAAAVLIHLGVVEIAAKYFDQSKADLEGAETIDSSKSGEARMWLAIAQQHQNNLEAADALYQNALAAVDPTSGSAVTIMRLYAQLLQQQGRPDEASKMQDEAAGILTAQATQAAASSEPSSSDVYRIGGDVTAPSVLSKTEPAYSVDARIAKYQGTILLSVEIGADGVPRNIRVVRPLGLGLDQKAIDALGRWKFKPATKDGQPVKVRANVEINFRLL